MGLLPLRSYLDRLPQVGADNLESSLRRTLHGQPYDWVTPLLDRDLDLDYQRVELRDWALSRVIPTGYSWLDEIEREQSGKIGAYSIMLPWEFRREQVNAYFSQADPTIGPGELDRAIRSVSGIFPRDLDPVPLKDAFAGMPRGTNLGSPWFTADAHYLSSVLQIAENVVASDYSDFPDDACAVYWRGQPRGIGEDPKQRTVWGYPHWIIALELMLQEKLLPVLRVRAEFAAWNDLDFVDRTVTDIINGARGDILSVDFSGFDASVPSILITAAFQVIRTAFRKEWWKLVDFVEDRFLHIGLITPEGIRVGRKGGVPSGSGLTNLVDSIVQLIAWHIVAERIGLTIRAITVQGDDGVVEFGGQWDLDQISTAMLELGLKVSSDKGGVSMKQVRFLQNVHSEDYRLSGICVRIRPILRVLNGMMSYEYHPDDRIWRGVDDTIRWRQQAESAKYHPRFRALVELLISRDKYSVYSGDELVRTAGGIGKVEAALKQTSFPYGKESLSKLSQFRIERELATWRARRGRRQASA